MDRVAVEAYLNAEYPELIEEAALADLESVLDQTEAALDARPDVSTAWQYAIADYYLLKRIRAVFAVNFDTSDKDGSYSLSQQYKALEAMLAAAAKKVGWIVDPPVVDPETEGIGKLVTITAPYLTQPYSSGSDSSW